jgi:uncharacterized protein YbbK (DUF523 family)
MNLEGQRIMVSACLMGCSCRYDGKLKRNWEVVRAIGGNQKVFICPEQLGGLPTPRPRAERVGDKVLTENGEDVTEQFESGAQKALVIAQGLHCGVAILKSNSPSCGCGQIYDGSFTGVAKEGDGVCAELFKKHGITVLTENDI